MLHQGGSPCLWFSTKPVTTSTLEVRTEGCWVKITDDPKSLPREGRRVQLKWQDGENPDGHPTTNYKLVWRTWGERRYEWQHQQFSYYDILDERDKHPRCRGGWFPIGAVSVPAFWKYGGMGFDEGLCLV